MDGAGDDECARATPDDIRERFEEVP